MADERHRVAVDPGYANEIGIATYCFALCEWNAVWCAEKLQADYIRTIGPKKKTAGKIAKDLLRLAEAIGSPELRAHLVRAANEFTILVKERNALFHAKPGTAKSGEQRLFRHGNEWTPEAIRGFSDRVTECSVSLNRILHERLM